MAVLSPVRAAIKGGVQGAVRSDGVNVGEVLGGLGTLELLWLPDGVQSSGSDVTGWTDVSGNGNDGGVSGTPQVISGGGAFLDGTEYLSFTTRLTNIRTVLWRLALSSRPASGAEARLLLGDSSLFDYYGSEGVSGPVFSAFAAAAVKAGTFKVDGSVETGTSYVLPAGASTKRTLSLVTTGNTTANRFSQDRGVTAKNWHGSLYALAIYSDALSGANVSEAEAIFDTL